MSALRRHLKPALKPVLRPSSGKATQHYHPSSDTDDSVYDSYDYQKARFDWARDQRRRQRRGYGTAEGDTMKGNTHPSRSPYRSPSPISREDGTSRGPRRSSTPYPSGRTGRGDSDSSSSFISTTDSDMTGYARSKHRSPSRDSSISRQRSSQGTLGRLLGDFMQPFKDIRDPPRNPERQPLYSTRGPLGNVVSREKNPQKISYRKTAHALSERTGTYVRAGLNATCAVPVAALVLTAGAVAGVGVLAAGAMSLPGKAIEGVPLVREHVAGATGVAYMAYKHNSRREEIAARKRGKYTFRETVREEMKATDTPGGRHKRAAGFGAGLAFFGAKLRGELRKGAKSMLGPGFEAARNEYRPSYYPKEYYSSSGSSTSGSSRSGSPSPSSNRRRLRTERL